MESLENHDDCEEVLPKSELEQLPHHVLFQVFANSNLGELKNLRRVSKFMNNKVTRYWNRPKFCKNLRTYTLACVNCEELFQNPPSCSVGTLQNNHGSVMEAFCHFRLDCSEYLKMHATYITSFKTTWFFCCQLKPEWDFLNQLQFLEKLSFGFVTSLPPDARIVNAEVPSCLKTIKTFKTPWAAAFQQIKWFPNSFPALKKLCLKQGSTGTELNEFLRNMSQYMNFRKTSSTSNLEILDFGATLLSDFANNNVSNEILTEFVDTLVACHVKIAGVTAEILYRVEKQVTNSVFLQLLSLVVNLSGYHPKFNQVTNIALEQINFDYDSDNRFKEQSDSWLNAASTPILMGQLKAMEIKICIGFVQGSHHLEKKIVSKMVDTFSSCIESSELTDLHFTFSKPGWYPVYFRPSKLVNNFNNLKAITINAKVNDNNLVAFFRVLSNSKVEYLALHNCLIGDDAFAGEENVDLSSYFLRLKDLKTFFLSTDNVYTDRFFTNTSFMDVLRFSRLNSLSLTGSFPMVTDVGLNFLMYGPHLMLTLRHFEFTTASMPSSNITAIENIKTRCRRNLHEFLADKSKR